MKRQISFQQYRNIDLIILLAVLAVCQLLTHFAVAFWFPEQLYVVSPVAGLTALVMMRWSGFGAIHAALGGLLFAVLSGGTWQQILIYTVGNLAALLMLLMLKRPGKEQREKDGCHKAKCCRKDCGLTVSCGHVSSHLPS